MKKLIPLLMVLMMTVAFAGCGSGSQQTSGGDGAAEAEQTEASDTNIKLTKGNPNKLKRSDYESDEAFELAISEQYDDIEGYAVTSDALIGEDIPAGTYYVYDENNWVQFYINEGAEDEELINMDSGDSCTLKDGQKISCTNPCKFEPVK